MRHAISMVLWLSVLAVACATSSAADPPISDSVVRITVTRRAPNVVQPWTKAAPSEASGTGFVIEGQRLVTNAHVVEYASQIYVQPNKSAEKYEAKVEALSGDMDLAVLRVADESFFESRPSIPMLAEIPRIKSPVNVYGYPVGGEQQSVTEGIISRIDFVRYTTGIPGLRIQIDAALNPGNSGGPAISGGKLIGVAFQLLQQAENVGYVILVEELTAFLEDVKDGKYDGKPQLIGEYQTVENDSIRARLKLAKGEGGAMLCRSVEGQAFPIQPGDVITHIGDVPIDQTSKVKVSEELTLPYSYLVPKLAKSGTIHLRVKRQGQSLEIDAPVVTREPELVRSLRGGYPNYFIYGPLVFSTATREFVSALGSRGFGLFVARQSPFITRVGNRPQMEGEELVVVASPMFSHRITKGYSQPFGACVASVNGVSVKNMRHLVTLLRDAQEEFVEFEFLDRATERIVFRRTEILDATDEILTDNGIRKQYSDDLEPVWKGSK